MRTITVRQIDLKDDHKHIALHTFDFPEVGDKGFYRQVTSYSAFFDGTKRKNRNDHHLFSVIDFRDGDLRTGYELKRDAALPVMKHEDLYRFFSAIGYDRTKRKYVKCTALRTSKPY